MMSGRMTTKLVIRRPNRDATKLADGSVDLGNAANWQTFCQRRGSVREVSAREVYQLEQTQAVRSHEVRLLGDSHTRQIRADYKLTYVDRDGVSHDLFVVGATTYESGRYVVLSCLEAAQ